MPGINSEELAKLLKSLAALPHETEWLEFKHNNFTPDDIGEYVSALANSAALHGKDRGYIVWGVADGTHALVGTTFRPRESKVGNEELENWIAKQLHPPIHFTIHEAEIEGKQFVAIEVPPATHTPVRFKDFEYIRVGTYKKKLRDHPEKERALWSTFATSAFEDGLAIPNATSDQVLSLLDYPNYFRLMLQPLPDNRAAILDRLAAERMINRKSGDQFQITNLGAIFLHEVLGNFSGSRARHCVSLSTAGTVALRPSKNNQAIGATPWDLKGRFATSTTNCLRTNKLDKPCDTKCGCSQSLRFENSSRTRLSTRIFRSPAPDRWWRFLPIEWKFRIRVSRSLIPCASLTNRLARGMRFWQR